MNKALVTGGAGFLGSFLVESLVRRGVEVVVLDNLFRGNMSNLSEVIGSPNLTVVRGDILELNTVESAMRGCDLVFHLAAINGTRYFYENPELVLKVNVGGTENVLEAAKTAKVKRVVFTSSSEVYGHPNTFPTPETSPAIFEPPNSVRWSYAISKLLDEHICLAAARQGVFDTVILRVFNAYGPRLLGSPYGQVVAIFARALLTGKPPVIYGDGEQTRSFTYITDIAEGIIQAAESDGAANQVFNLGSETETTINELANMMVRIADMNGMKPIHAEAEYRDEPRRRCPSTRKAQETFDYCPRVSFQEGLKHTIEWTRCQKGQGGAL